MKLLTVGKDISELIEQIKWSGDTKQVARVKISDLKMRLGATIDTASVGHIPVGSYTIVEEKYGKVSKSGEEGLWGRIKSEQPYNGKYVPVWICLSYTEKV